MRALSRADRRTRSHRSVSQHPQRGTGSCSWPSPCPIPRELHLRHIYPLGPELDPQRQLDRANAGCGRHSGLVADILKGLLLRSESALGWGHGAQAGRQVDHKTVAKARNCLGAPILCSECAVNAAGVTIFDATWALWDANEHFRARKTGQSCRERLPFQNVWSRRVHCARRSKLWYTWARRRG
jgi:hypothetical protein